MKNLFDLAGIALKNLPVIKHYAQMLIHVIDTMDGVKQWKQENPPPTVSGTNKTNVVRR